MNKITPDIFILKYWKYYIQIEKEFVQTINYVSIDSSNFNCYSDAYMKLMLQIGSEVDITCKLLCNLLGDNIKNGTIGKYKECITKHIKDFCNIRITEKQSKISSCPWEEWKCADTNPTWWVIYNKIKHHRVSSGSIVGVKQEYFKFANLKYTMLSLMGLYQIMLYSYYYLAKAESKKVFVPLPASRLFETESSIWKDTDLGTNLIMYVDDGQLCIETGLFEY